jgi:hypothetical protein
VVEIVRFSPVLPDDAAVPEARLQRDGGDPGAGARRHGRSVFLLDSGATARPVKRVSGVSFDQPAVAAGLGRD